VPHKEEVEEEDRSENRSQEFPDGQVHREIKDHIDDDAKHGAHSVIDDPGGSQEVSRFPLIGITAAGTSIEGSKPVA
jgi:hypothetical protein